MKHHRHRLAGLLAGLLLAPGLAAASEIPPPEPLPAADPSLVHQAADLLIGRPVAAVRLVAGVLALPVALPVSLLLWDPGWALEVCVEDPFADLVETPLTTP